MIEFSLVVVFASAFVLVMFWLVAKTIGKLSVVKNSPTLNDVQDFIYPKLAEQRSHARAETLSRSETLPRVVRELADAGDKLGAIKMYMDETGLSLMESKKTVEAYMNSQDHAQ
jgi:ribosomal protein L7/L12